MFEGEHSRKFHHIARVAEKKLIQLDSAEVLDDVGFFPGNHLELLKGDRRGRYSIRINLQYRICFSWKDGAAADVEIVDYH